MKVGDEVIVFLNMKKEKIVGRGVITELADGVVYKCHEVSGFEKDVLRRISPTRIELAYIVDSPLYKALE